MKRAAISLLASIFGATGLLADLSPEAWHSEPLDTAGANNGWYFMPDTTGNPRILVKVTNAGNKSSRKLLTGGPPTWTADAPINLTGFNGQGIFLPTSGGGGYLVGVHNSNTLKLAIISNTGTATVSLIENSTPTALSAAFDPDGNLHVSYVLNAATNNEMLCYGRLVAGEWNIVRQHLTDFAQYIQSTAVLPTSANEANVYYVIDGGPANTLARVTPIVHGGNLVLSNPANFDRIYVSPAIAVAHIADQDRVYLFQSDSGATEWTLRRLDVDESNTRASEAADLEAAGVSEPRKIILHYPKSAPANQDAHPRIAWYDGAQKAIHYLKPALATSFYTSGKPVLTSGNQTNANLDGLHFGPDGRPYILYHEANNKGFVAFPNDEFDFNGNGRADIVDAALGSESAGLTTLPVAKFAPNIPNSDNRLKFTFPTMSDTRALGINSLVSSSKNYRYTFELSPDMVTWTAENTFGKITFTNTGTTGTEPNQRRIFTAVINDPAPGVFPSRFARMVVTRSSYPY